MHFAECFTCKKEFWYLKTPGTKHRLYCSRQCGWKGMMHNQVNFLGMILDEWTEKSCVAHIAVNNEKKWATIYDIQSEEEGCGHASKLLKETKKYYESKGLKFGGSIALNDRMRKLYKKLNITEYAS